MFDIANLNDDYFSQLDPNEILDVKPLSVEEKVQCFQFFLDSDIITNVSVISNIFIMINGITSIDDSALKDERVFFNSLEEYVDIKLQLKFEIDTFNIYLLEYYLGVIEGLDVVLDELKTHIPNTHFNLLPLCTPNLISRLMLKYLQRIDPLRVKPHFCANEIYAKINQSDSLIMGFLQNVLKKE